MTENGVAGNGEVEPGEPGLDPSPPYEPTERTTVWRLVLGTVGVGGILYGAVRILQTPASSKPLDLLEWLVAALVLHDGILAPVVTVFGLLMARVVPGRARAYIQGGLVAGALVTTFTLVEVYRQGRAKPGMALLQQDYALHLVVVLAVIAVLTVVLYLTRVLRDRRA